MANETRCEAYTKAELPGDFRLRDPSGSPCESAPTMQSEKKLYVLADFAPSERRHDNASIGSVSEEQPNSPLHGITLLALLEELVLRHGWHGLGARIPVRCFTHEPSVASSLKFLRRTDWARKQVEALYLDDLRRRAKNQARAARRAHSARE
jgi:hypothetical protein